MRQNDRRYVYGIIAGDGAIVNEFFYEKMYDAIQYLNYSIWGGRMDFDELVSELYLHLAENDFRRLRLFVGDTASLKTWVSKIAKRLFLAKDHVIGPISTAGDKVEEVLPETATDRQEDVTASMIDLRVSISKLSCRRYAQVASLLYMDRRDEAFVRKIMQADGATWHCLKKHTREALLNHMAS